MFTKHVTKQLSAYCNDELAADESQRVRGHLLVCERCRKEHDEIKLGVGLAQQLPLVTAPAELWSEIESLLDARSRRLPVEPRASTFGSLFTWQRVAISAVLVIAAIAGFIISSRPDLIMTKPTPTPQDPRASWEVSSFGAVRIEGDQVREKGRLAIGETLETGDSSRAIIAVSEIGQVELAPNSKMRLLQTQETEHRLALDRGLLKATISAPPRLFFVDTPAAQAIDLGCMYTLQVDDAGASVLHVTLGWVALVRNGREVYVPRYAMCQARPGIGPGTPYFEDASEVFVRALEEFDFENGGEQAFGTVLAQSRPRDTFTLWHLLSRVEGEQRTRVLNRMIALVGLPHGITRKGMLQLDQEMLDAFRDEMDTVWF